MLARRCLYPLQSDVNLYVDITVNPCCTIDIIVPQKGQRIRSQLALIDFTPNEKNILLSCYAKDDVGPQSIHLELSYSNAIELCEIIDEVKEEHEDIMSALCY